MLLLKKKRVDGEVPQAASIQCRILNNVYSFRNKVTPRKSVRHNRFSVKLIAYSLHIKVLVDGSAAPSLLSFLNRQGAWRVRVTYN